MKVTIIEEGAEKFSDQPRRDFDFWLFSQILGNG